MAHDDEQDPAEDMLRYAMFGGDPSLSVKPYRYKERGLPCVDARGHDMPWCVSGYQEFEYMDGSTGRGGGVLEWCYDEEDAYERLRLMRPDPRFSDLRVERTADFDIKKHLKKMED